MSISGRKPSSELFTSVEDGLPLVEVALVGQRVEVAALDVSEAGLPLAARCRVARLVPAPLSQTVLPSVLWAAG